MLSLWQRLPVVVRAVVVGTVATAAGTVPWSLLAAANLRFLIVVPWAIVPAGLYLWLLWRYLGGDGWPASTSSARRSSLRANVLSSEVWGSALVAGLLGLSATMPLTEVWSRLVKLPAESQPIVVPSGMPFVTVFLLLVMASVIAGVIEEAGFRGYMQGAIERRHGPVVAMLSTGTLFGLLHFTHHPQGVFVMLPYYVAIATVFGGLAWLTNSILPGLVLHAGADVFALSRLWITGRPEWQQSPTPQPLVWNGGADASFWTNVVMLFALGGLAVWAYFGLAGVVRRQHARPQALGTATHSAG